MRRRLLLSTIAILCFILSSCVGEINEADTNVDYRASLALPVGTANFGLEDLLEKFYDGDDLYPDGANHYYFYMKNDNAFSFREINLLQENTTVTSGEDFNLSETLGGITGTIDPNVLPESDRTVTINKENFIDFSITTTGVDECIDSAGIEHSRLYIRLKNTSSSLNITIKKFQIEFPMYDYTTREQKYITLPNSDYTSINFGEDYYFDIDDFMVKIEDNPLKPGQGGFHFNVKIDAVVEGGTLNASDVIGYDVTYTIFQHKVVYGKFSPDSNIAKTTVPLNFNLIRDINDGKSEGVLLFEDMDISLMLRNYDIGMYVKMALDTIKGVRRDYPDETPRYAMFDGGYNYGTSRNFTTRPTVPFSGQPSVLSFKINQEEAQVQNFFQRDFMTDQFIFSFSAAVENHSDPLPMFVTKDARIDCDVEFKIPLNLRPLSYYVYTDTIKDFEKNVDSGIFQYIDTAELYIGLENGLPVGTEMSLYFVNEEGDTLFSIDKAYDNETGIETPLYVSKPTTNVAGEVLDKGLSKATFRVVLDNGKMEDLRNSKYIFYSVRAENEDTTDNIYFKDDNRFNISLKIFAKGGYTGNLGKEVSK